MDKVIAFEWGAVVPEVILAVTAIAALLLAAFSGAGARAGWAVRAFSAFGILAAMFAEYFFGASAAGGPLPFGGTLNFAPSFSYFVMLCGLLSIAMTPRLEKRAGEFCAIMLICAAALSVFVRAQNLMLAFVALECATVCLYILVAWGRERASSLEAAVRYLIAGGASGAILLLGIAFLYGAGFSYGVSLLNIANLGVGVSSPLMWTGLVFVFAGLFFKMSAFPFQFWAPGVYQGAPSAVSAFLSVASKGAGAVFCVKICACLASFTADMVYLNDKLVLAFSAVAALTIIVGNLGGITQTNAKRLMGFSGIANAGYLLVLAAAVLRLGMPDLCELTLYFYLVSYMFANYGAFCALGGFAEDMQSSIGLGDFRGMLRKDAPSALALVTNLSSLAGIPPTAGFFGKLLLLLVAWYAELYWLMGVVIFGSVVSIYYYFSWIRAAVDSSEKGDAQFKISDLRATTLVALSAGSLFLGTVLFYFTTL